MYIFEICDIVTASSPAKVPKYCIISYNVRCIYYGNVKLEEILQFDIFILQEAYVKSYNKKVKLITLCNLLSHGKKHILTQFRQYSLFDPP